MRGHTYTIEWDREAAKVYGSIRDNKLKDHILNVLESVIAHDPLAGKPLVGPLKGVRSYRVGVIRILYKHYKERLVVVVLDIAHRREVYR